MRTFKSLLLVLLAVLLLVTGCTNEQDAVSSGEKNEAAVQNKESNKAETSSEEVGTTASSEEIPQAFEKPIKIAAIMQLSIGTFSSQYIQGVKEQVESFGGEVQIYNADNDLTKMASLLDTAVNQNVDAILIDHGRADALEPGVKKALEKGIPVVAFDNDLNLPGVTVIDQDDYSLAWNSLKTLAQDLNGQGEIVYIWVGGFTPMERRNVIYEAFKQRYPNIKEVARFGTASANTALDTQTQMEAILQRYPNKGDIDAVFATWDEFAKGASKAIKQAGRDEIKVYGIDLSDEDLQLMQEANSPWTATAATDPSEIGRIQVRFAYQKIAGEATPEIYSVDPYLVKRSQLPDTPVSMNDIGNYINGWGSSEAAVSPWMDKLEGREK